MKTVKLETWHRRPGTCIQIAWIRERDPNHYFKLTREADDIAPHCWHGIYHGDPATGFVPGNEYWTDLSGELYGDGAEVMVVFVDSPFGVKR